MQAFALEPLKAEFQKAIIVKDIDNIKARIVDYDNCNKNEIQEALKIENASTIIYSRNGDINIDELDLVVTYSEDDYNYQKDNNIKNDICAVYDINVDGYKYSEIISVTYENNVDVSVINTFKRNLTENSFVVNLYNQFVAETKLDIKNNIMDSNITRSTIVANVKNTNYFIGNYTINGTNYPLLVYKNNITYQALRINDTIPQSDFYDIIAYVTTIPGTNLSTAEAEYLTNYAVSGLYNSTYGNAVVIKNTETFFINDHTNTDEFLDMTPRQNMTKANNKTINLSLGYPPSFAFSFDFTVTTGSNVSLNYTFEPYGRSSIKYEAWLPWLTILKPCLSTSQFHHVCGIYMQTDTHTLNMRVGTHHGYYYMNDESHVILAGLTQTINYNTGE